MARTKIIIFIAPPGAGKGSISQECVQKLGWEQLSTGNLCREHIAKGTEIGQKIDFAIKSGKLISDSLIVDMVRKWFADKNTDNAVLLDGFPRTVPQALAFKEMIENDFPDVDVQIIQLKVDDGELMRRLTSRLTCSNKKCQNVYSLLPESGMLPNEERTCEKCGSALMQRADDTVETVKDRLSNYYHHEHDLLDYYSSAHFPIITVDANKPFDEVYSGFKDVIGL